MDVTDPAEQIRFIIEELWSEFVNAKGNRMTLTSMVGSRFHRRVTVAAKALGIEGDCPTHDVVAKAT